MLCKCQLLFALFDASADSHFPFCSDPQGLIEIVGALYTDKDFYTSLYNSLNDDGILVAQVGEAHRLDDAAEEISKDMHRASLINGLIEAGFEGIREYEEVSSRL